MKNALINKLKRYFYLVFYLLLFISITLINPLSGREIVNIEWKAVLYIVLFFLIENGLEKEKIVLPLFRLLNSVKSLPLLLVLLTLSSALLSFFLFDFITVMILVPFTIELLKVSNKESYITSVVAFMTVAAIVTNAFSPFGEANIFLYSTSQFNYSSSLIPQLIFLALLLIEATLVIVPTKRMELYLHIENEDYWERERKGLRIFYLALFVLLLFLPRFNTIDIFLVVMVSILLFDKGLFKKVDYSILLGLITVVLIGQNLKTMEIANNKLNTLLSSIALTRLGSFSILGGEKTVLFETLPSIFLSFSFSPLISYRLLKKNGEERGYLKKYSLLSLPFVVASIILFLS